MSQELLLELGRRGIRLRLVDDRIDVLAPAGSLTGELREQLRAHRDSLRDLLRAAEDREGPDAVPADPEHAHEPFELTDIQHAYWVGANPAVELGGVSTHFYFELERDGLDPQRLGRAFQAVVARHPMLRAEVMPDGRQRVLPQVPEYQIEVADLRDLPGSERDAYLAAVRADMGGRAPTSERWPLFEIRLSRLEGARTRLHVSVNLLIMDAHSLSLMFADWQRWYEEPDWAPPPLPFTFRDYVRAAAGLREGGAYRAAEKYWLSRLDSLPPAPELPLARQPAQLERVEFTGRAARLGAGQWSQVKARAAARRLTPSVVLMTAFTDVLRAWSAQPGFTLNVTLFNRPPVHPDIGRIIGDFTSLTMLEVPAPGPEQTFAGRAAALQAQLMRDLEHVAYSGVRVLRERARNAGAGREAAMPVVFTAAVPLTGAATGDGGRPFFGDLVYTISQTPQVYLDHQTTEERGELLFNWDCVEELFPAGLLDDAFGSYRRLLERLCADEQAWDSVEPEPLLPPWQAREREAANDTAAPTCADTLCGLVEAQARRTPDAVAVLAGDGTRSYAEVSADAHRLARRLSELGAGRGAVVAVVMDKGWAQVPAVLGVCAAGAAYLPVDPQWPAARRDELLAACGVTVAVTTDAHRTGLTWPAGVEPITLTDPQVLAADPAPLQSGPAPEDLAYVIFTSGSTGRPKGVVIDHRGAVNTILDINARFQVGPQDRVLALSALSFDLSVYDIFGVLAAGGAVVLPDAVAGRDAAHWSELIEAHRVTIWNSVPALLQAWLEARPPGAGPASLRLALLSGDWIPVGLPDALRTAQPGVRVVSLGGATEASIWSVWYPIGEVPPQWSRIPYGKPLGNQALHVYDDRLGDRPVWTVGELYIGGTGVARGYWGDAEQTGYRFVTHPTSGERLYRTGDLARYLPGGDIEFLGRADFQVKLNGYRIELDEIAHALRGCAGVADALVDVVTHPQTGRRQLVGYVVAADPATPAGPTSIAPQAVEPQGLEPQAVESRAVEPPAGWAALLAAGRDEVARVSRELAADLDTFDDWWRQLDELCPDIIAATLAQLGRFTVAGEVADADGIVRDCGIRPAYTGLVEQWLAALAGAGMLRPSGAGGYRCERALDRAELDSRVTAGLAGISVTGVHRTFLDYMRACAANQVGLLRGEVSPLQLLFDPAGAVTDVLYATNPSSRVQNAVAARLARTLADQRPEGRPLRVLEVGAGTGATSVAILGAVPAGRVRYRFTDISTYFTERARQRLAHYPEVSYGTYDIDRDPAAQGLTPGSVDLIVAANVMHDAADPAASLARLRTGLAEGGVLLLIEGTANSRVQLISVGFIEGFGQPQERRGPALRGVEAWRELTGQAGLVGFTALPDAGPVCSAMAQQVLVAAAPDGAPGGVLGLDPQRLQYDLAELLPEYMVPQRYLTIDRIPLNANGKVDRAALPSPWDTGSTASCVPPRDKLESRLLDIWQEALGRTDFGVEDSFFELGADSLHAVRVLGRLREEYGVELNANDGLRMLFDRPSVSGMAGTLRELGTAP